MRAKAPKDATRLAVLKIGLRETSAPASRVRLNPSESRLQLSATSAKRDCRSEQRRGWRKQNERNPAISQKHQKKQRQMDRQNA